MSPLLRDDKRKRAVASGERSVCPECGEEIVGKCGEIRVWHWSHLKTGECSYGKGKGEWHLKWQDWFFNHGCSIEKKINQNRADVVLPNGVVIEL
jgi:competence CoiA-like predicted nuclease